MSKYNMHQIEAVKRQIRKAEDRLRSLTETEADRIAAYRVADFEQGSMIYELRKEIDQQAQAIDNQATALLSLRSSNDSLRGILERKISVQRQTIIELRDSLSEINERVVSPQAQAILNKDAEIATLEAELTAAKLTAFDVIAMIQR